MSDPDDPRHAPKPPAQGAKPQGRDPRPPDDCTGLDRILLWVFASMLRLLRDRDRATAAVSRAFLDYVRASQRQRIDHAAAWLLAVAQKKALLSDETPSGMTSLDHQPDHAPAAAVPPSPTDLQQLEVALVAELIRRTPLRGHQRQILSLFLEGLAPSAIASRLDLPLAKVERSRASGCARLLRTAEQCHFAPDLQALVDRLLDPGSTAIRRARKKNE